jgi:hypothetical protein
MQRLEIAGPVLQGKLCTKEGDLESQKVNAKLESAAIERDIFPVACSPLDPTPREQEESGGKVACCAT